MKRISCKRGTTIGEAAAEICKMIEREYPDSDVAYFVNQYFERKTEEENQTEEE